MKRIALALFLVWATPAAGQAPAADWRAVVSDRDRDFIENWERYFELAIVDAMRPGRYSTPDLSESALRAMMRLPYAAFRPEIWAGRPACRVTTLSFSVYVNHWLHCRVFFDGADWRVEKRSGQHYLNLRLVPDPRFGTVAIGAEWASASPDMVYGHDPDRNAVGVVFQAGDSQLQILLPTTGITPILELDLRRQFRNRDVPPAERGRPAAPIPGRGDSAR